MTTCSENNINMIDDLTPLYLTTQKDIVKMLRERLYQVRSSDKNKYKKTIK